MAFDQRCDGALDHVHGGLVVANVMSALRRAKHRETSSWDEYPSDTNIFKDWKNWRRMLGVVDQDWGDFTLEIVDSLSELKGKVPDKLYERVADIAERAQVEDLDI